MLGRGGLVPVYPHLQALDVLDYSEQTIWTGEQREHGVRRKVIGEARRMDAVQDDAYDAVLASHVLEHVADPIGALTEWQRVVRPGGHVLLAMPHYEGTFDHHRPVTTIDHMRADAERGTGEDDMTHLQEILELHDLGRDPGAPSREVFERRCRENPSTRSMHHHVFDSLSVVETCRAAGLEVTALVPRATFNIVCLGRVGGDGQSDLDDRALEGILRESPFDADRSAAQRLAGGEGDSQARPPANDRR